MRMNASFLEIRNLKLEMPHFSEAGQSLIELIIAIAIAAIIMPALFYGMITSTRSKAQETQSLAANALLREGIEATRSVREANWSNIATDGTYYAIVSGGVWQLTTTIQPPINGFTRTIVISSVQRDNNGNIVTSGGTVDPSTKRAIVTVPWSTPYSSSISSTIYLTRYLNNQSFIETTTLDFNAGIKTNTQVTDNAGDGTVKLANLGGVGGAGANWCNPSAFQGNTLNISGSGTATALTAILGEAFVGIGANNSGPDFQRVTGLSSNPPIPASGGTFNGGHKTNDVFGDATHMYLTTDTNSAEVVIVAKSNMAAQAGAYNISGNTDGISIFVAPIGVNTIGFATAANNSLYSFNLNNKSSPAALSTIALGALGTSVYVVGNYAFVTRDTTSQQLRIYQINTNGTIVTTAVGSYTVTGGTGGMDVYVSPDGSRAYMVTKTSATQPELFILDTTTKSTPTLINSLNLSNIDPRAVDMVLSNNRAIIVGVGTNPYQVIRIPNSTAPSVCGFLTSTQVGTTTVYDVANVEITADNRAYAYIAVGSDPEFKIIQGGTGGEFVPSGNFESRTLPLNLTIDASFNRFIATYLKPGNSTIEFQVAVKDAVSGSCSGVVFATTDFVGPDKTSNTRFTNNNSFPTDNNGAAYENPGRCVRYKVFFTPTTDFLSTPELQNITINYTP